MPLDANPEVSEQGFDAKDVLREYGWECGPEFDRRYLTDTWVFNLVNIIYRERTEVKRLRARLDDLQADGRRALELARKLRREGGLQV